MKFNPENPFNRPTLLTPRSIHSVPITIPTNSYLRNSHIRTEHYPINVWSFRDDHDSGFNSLFLRKNLNQSGISNFEKAMMVNVSSSRRRIQSHYTTDSTKRSRIDSNPFHRKNLLISRNEVEEQIQRDLMKVNYDGFINLSPSRRHSQRNSIDYDQSRKSDGIDPSKNTSLIMNLIDKVIPDIITKQPQQRVFRQSRQPGNNKDIITVRGKKFYQTRVHPI